MRVRVYVGGEEVEVKHAQARMLVRTLKAKALIAGKVAHRTALFDPGSWEVRDEAGMLLKNSDRLSASSLCADGFKIFVAPKVGTQG